MNPERERKDLKDIFGKNDRTVEKQRSAKNKRIIGKYEITQECGSNSESITDSLSPSPDSLNADIVSHSSNSSDGGSGASGSFKSTLSSGYDSCNSSGVPIAPPPPPPAASVSNENVPSLQKNILPSCSNSSFEDETPPPLPTSPPPDLCSSALPPFYVPSSSLPPPLFHQASSLSKSMPMIKKLTEDLSASTPHIMQDISDCSVGSSFEDISTTELPSANPLLGLSCLSTSTPNLSPKSAHRLTSVSSMSIELDNADSNDKKNSDRKIRKSQSCKSNSYFDVSADSASLRNMNLKSQSCDKDRFPQMTSPIMNISGPTNVCLPPSIDLSSSMYTPIRRNTPSPGITMAPNNLAFTDPYLTEVSDRRDTSPFARFCPQLPGIASSNLDRTKAFVRRSVKSPTLTSIRQSTRSLTSSAISSLRISSRNFRSTLLASLHKASSMENLDSLDIQNSKSDKMNISSPCPQPDINSGICLQESFDSSTLRSMKRKSKFSSLHKSSPKRDRYNIKANSLYHSNPINTSPNATDDQETTATLMAFKSYSETSGSCIDLHSRDDLDSECYPDFHHSMSSLNGSFDSTSRDFHSHSQTPDNTLRKPCLYSESEVDSITKNIGRITTVDRNNPENFTSNEESLASKLKRKLNTSEREWNIQSSADNISQTQDLCQSPDRKLLSLKDHVKNKFKVRERRKAMLSEISEERNGHVQTEKNTSTLTKKLAKGIKKKIVGDDTSCAATETIKLQLRPVQMIAQISEHKINRSLSSTSAPSNNVRSLRKSQMIENKSDNSMTTTLLSRNSVPPPTKPKPLAGLAIDEKQMELQQQLLHCLKKRLNEYNTRGSISPQPEIRIPTPPPLPKTTSQYLRAPTPPPLIDKPSPIGIESSSENDRKVTEELQKLEYVRKLEFNRQKEKKEQEKMEQIQMEKRNKMLKDQQEAREKQELERMQKERENVLNKQREAREQQIRLENLVKEKQEQIHNEKKERLRKQNQEKEQQLQRFEQHKTKKEHQEMIARVKKEKIDTISKIQKDQDRQNELEQRLKIKREQLMKQNREQKRQLPSIDSISTETKIEAHEQGDIKLHTKKQKDRLKSQQRMLKELLESERRREQEMEDELKMQKDRLEKQQEDLRKQELDMESDEDELDEITEVDASANENTTISSSEKNSHSDKLSKISDLSVICHKIKNKSELVGHERKPVNQLKQQLLYHIEQHKIQQQKLQTKNIQSVPMLNSSELENVDIFSPNVNDQNEKASDENLANNIPCSSMNFEEQTDLAEYSLMLLPPPVNFCDQSGRGDTVSDQVAQITRDPYDGFRSSKRNKKKVTFEEKNTDSQLSVDCSFGSIHLNYNALTLKRNKPKSNFGNSGLTIENESDDVSFGESMSSCSFGADSLASLMPPSSLPVYSSDQESVSSPRTSPEPQFDFEEDSEPFHSHKRTVDLESFA